VLPVAMRARETDSKGKRCVLGACLDVSVFLLCRSSHVGFVCSESVVLGLPCVSVVFLPVSAYLFQCHDIQPVLPISHLFCPDLWPLGLYFLCVLLGGTFGTSTHLGSKVSGRIY